MNKKTHPLLAIELQMQIKRGHINVCCEIEGRWALSVAVVLVSFLTHYESLSRLLETLWRAVQFALYQQP